MTWFRCDDQLADHPKVMALAELRRPALGLWTMCGTYSARYLTDGYVPRTVVAMYADRDLRRLTDALVRVGLFVVADGGWRLHDYLDWNPSRDDVMAERARKAAAGQAGGQASARARGKAGASPVLPEPAVPPTRPDPTRSDERDARGPDDIELAVLRLRNGNASEKQIDTIRGLFEQVGDEARCFEVLARWEQAPLRDKYGPAQAELVQLSAERKRSRGSRAVRPTTSYDAIMESDDDDARGAA